MTRINTNTTTTIGKDRKFGEQKVTKLNKLIKWDTIRKCFVKFNRKYVTFGKKSQRSHIQWLKVLGQISSPVVAVVVNNQTYIGKQTSRTTSKVVVLF